MTTDRNTMDVCDVSRGAWGAGDHRSADNDVVPSPNDFESDDEIEPSDQYALSKA